MMVHRDGAARIRANTRARSGQVTVTRVEDAAWQTALFLAHGDRRRLRVLDRRTVIVANRP